MPDLPAARPVAATRGEFIAWLIQVIHAFPGQFPFAMHPAGQAFVGLVPPADGPLFTAGPPADPINAPGRGPDQAALRPLHRRLVQVATTTPVPAKELIRRAGYRVNSWSRDGVTWLCRNGYLVNGPDGVQLGPTPLP